MIAVAGILDGGVLLLENVRSRWQMIAVAGILDG
nr:hypothetical protein [Tanacetum cinerariifolium]